MSSYQNPYASTVTELQRPTGPLLSVNQTLAGRGERLLASIVDGVILVVVFLPIMMVVGVVLAIAGVAVDGLTFEIISTVLSFVFLAMTFLAINGYLLANRGQTIGKYLMKIRIVDSNGQIPEFYGLFLKRYVAIWLISFIPFFGRLFGIANVLAIFRASRRCIHDEIADTNVVNI